MLILILTYFLLLLFFFLFFFFFNDTATTEIYTLSLHDALAIRPRPAPRRRGDRDRPGGRHPGPARAPQADAPRNLRRRSHERRRPARVGQDVQRGRRSTPPWSPWSSPPAGPWTGPPARAPTPMATVGSLHGKPARRSPRPGARAAL